MKNVTPIRLHLTNVTALGAIQLLKSLLPAILSLRGWSVKQIYLPARGDLASFQPAGSEVPVSRYRRVLPNAVSRVIECTLLGGRFDGAAPLLVFGDIPLRSTARQTVFVQTPLLVDEAAPGVHASALKYRVMRWLFRRNARYASDFVVQTEAMKAALGQRYPEIAGRIHVIAQPAPEWLLRAKLRRTGTDRAIGQGLRLLYPAAAYPHKNHRLLGQIQADSAREWPVRELVLTIPDSLNPSRGVDWIRCVGRLSASEMLAAYSAADALVFLSHSESLGFPLVEAMWIGLPVVCTDRGYARVLCGDQAIYFDPDAPDALRAALVQLRERLDAGWWPSWAGRLAGLPESWAQVAEALLEVGTRNEVDRNNS